jgi:thiol:disulfide interchange protein DsbD
MWGKWTDFSTPARKVWTIRAIALLIAVGTGVWLLPARGQVPQGALDWESYDAALVRQAGEHGRPVLLKFTADWCTNCKVLERRVYHDPQVVALLKQHNVLPIKADTTLIDYPATRDLKQVYGEAGNVPVTILLLPDGARQKLRGIFDKQELVTILNTLPEGKP